jgi:hypothetical protein
MFNLVLGRNRVTKHEHVQHCLGYLRALALCASDITLEPGDFTRRDFAAEGSGQTHECTDWSYVYDSITPVPLHLCKQKKCVRGVDV